MLVFHLLLCDKPSMSVSVLVGVVQRQALAQLSEQHGHFLHAPPATNQHHLRCHPVALTPCSIDSDTGAIYRETSLDQSYKGLYMYVI